MPGVPPPGVQMMSGPNPNMGGQVMQNNQLVRQPQAQGQRGMVPFGMPTVLDLREDVGFPEMTINYYEAWSLRRAPSDPGHGPSWAKININKMPISSEEIMATYSKHIKQQSGQVTKIYNALKSDKMRTAIDKAVNARNNNEQDRTIEWGLVHLDVTRKPIKAGLGTTAVETTQIAVILKKSHKPEVLAAMQAAAMQRFHQPNVQFMPGQFGNQQFMGHGGQPGNAHGNQHGGQVGGQGGGPNNRPPAQQGHTQPQIVQNFNVPSQQTKDKGKDKDKDKDKRGGSRGRQRSLSPDALDRIDRFLDGLEDHRRSHSDDSDTESIEIREFKRRISKNHGKNSTEYQRLLRGLDERDRRVERRQRSKSRKADDGGRRRKSTPGPRGRTASGSRRTKHQHRDGSESESSYEWVESDMDSSSLDDWSRREGGRRYRPNRIHSDYGLERPPSVGREVRRRSRTPGRDYFQQMAEMRRMDDELRMPMRQLPYRTLSYPYSPRSPPAAPLMADLKMSRQEEEALRVQEERRAYNRGRRDAEREQGFGLDSESTSDYDRRLEREVQASRGRIGRRMSSNLDGWPDQFSRRNEWP